MKLTDYLAVWGAVVGTVVAAWNIYKDFIKRDRVTVSAGFMVAFPPNEEVFSIKVTNHSASKIKVTHCGGYHDRHFEWRWFDKIARKFQKRSTKAFLFSFEPYIGPSLPFTIEPKDNVMISYKIAEDKFPVIETVEITTGDGRQWLAPRSNIRKIHADETYKKIRAKG
jgi:hypothetical protein